MIRFLDREAEITTRYGGGFVHSIDGIAGEIADGRSPRLVLLRQRDRVPARRRRGRGPRRRPDLVGLPRLDRRDRDPGGGRLVARAVPAGLEPDDERLAGDRRVPRARARPATRSPSGWPTRGVEASMATGDAEAAGRGCWSGPGSAVRADPLAGRARRGPATSGVFARFDADGGRLEARAAGPGRRRGARPLGAGAGLVAGMRDGEEPATWLVTGTDAAGVERAAELLDADDLAHRYAVAADGSRRAGPGAGDWSGMRSPLAYAPRPGPLARASARRRDRLPRLARGGRLRLLEPDRARRRRRRPSSSPGSPPGAARRARRRGALGARRSGS